MSIFKNCKWIWINDRDNADEYADFFASFELEGTDGIDLNISVDGNFEAYLNGELCAFGSCADYPHHKFYDSFCLDEYCQKGKNDLKITVWHIGVPSSVYAAANAGLIFNIRQCSGLGAFFREKLYFIKTDSVLVLFGIIRKSCQGMAQACVVLSAHIAFIETE